MWVASKNKNMSKLEDLKNRVKGVLELDFRCPHCRVISHLKAEPSWGIFCPACGKKNTHQTKYEK